MPDQGGVFSGGSQGRMCGCYLRPQQGPGAEQLQGPRVQSLQEALELQVLIRWNFAIKGVTFSSRVLMSTLIRSITLV